jgi:hypothetical protein
MVTGDQLPLCNHNPLADEVSGALDETLQHSLESLIVALKDHEAVASLCSDEEQKVQVFFANAALVHAGRPMVSYVLIVQHGVVLYLLGASI